MEWDFVWVRFLWFCFNTDTNWMFSVKKQHDTSFRKKRLWSENIVRFQNIKPHFLFFSQILFFPEFIDLMGATNVPKNHLYRNLISDAFRNQTNNPTYHFSFCCVESFSSSLFYESLFLFLFTCCTFEAEQTENRNKDESDAEVFISFFFIFQSSFSSCCVFAMT